MHNFAQTPNPTPPKHPPNAQNNAHTKRTPTKIYRLTANAQRNRITGDFSFGVRRQARVIAG